MAILFQSHATGEAVSITYEELLDRILKGDVVPHDQVKERSLTSDQWWDVNRLRAFHKLSPNPRERRGRKSKSLTVRGVKQQTEQGWEAYAITWNLAKEFFKKVILKCKQEGNLTNDFN